MKSPFEIFVFSLSLTFDGEEAFLNYFLEHGAHAVYLRKEELSSSQLLRYFEEVSPQFRSRLMIPYLSAGKDIVESYKPMIHVKEHSRDQINLSLIRNDLQFSTSIHELTHAPEIDPVFQYLFFSPVFNSISKPGHKPKFTADEIKEKLTSVKMKLNNIPTFNGDQRQIKIIALGGINEQNIRRVMDMGFDGAALLGAIWEYEYPRKKFDEIISKIHQTVL